MRSCCGSHNPVRRTMLQQLVHEVIAIEFRDEIGAARYERSTAQLDVHNEFRSRLFRICLGSLELRIPRGRGGEFCSSRAQTYK